MDEPMGHTTVNRGVHHGAPHRLAHGRGYGFVMKHITACLMAYTIGRTAGIYVSRKMPRHAPSGSPWDELWQWSRHGESQGYV